MAEENIKVNSFSIRSKAYASVALERPDLLAPAMGIYYDQISPDKKRDAFVDYSLQLVRRFQQEANQHSHNTQQYAREQAEIKKDPTKKTKLKDPGKFVPSSEYLTGATESLVYTTQVLNEDRAQALANLTTEQRFNYHTYKDKLNLNVPEALHKYVLAQKGKTGESKDEKVQAVFHFLERAEIGNLATRVQNTEYENMMASMTTGLEKETEKK